MNIVEFRKIQIGDRVVVKFNKGEQFAIARRFSVTNKGQTMLWVAPFNKNTDRFYEGLRRVGPGKVIRHCQRGEFINVYPPVGK